MEMGPLCIEAAISRRGLQLSDDMHDTYATFREFADLDKRHAALEASMTYQLTRVGADVSEIKAMLLRPQQAPVDHMALAMQRAMDELTAHRNGVSSNPIVQLLVSLALIVGAFLTGKIFF